MVNIYFILIIQCSGYANVDSIISDDNPDDTQHDLAQLVNGTYHIQ